MIRFAPIPRPADFEDAAERPGARWLAEHPAAKRPKDYWSPFKPDLADGFRQLCAYSAMYEPVGTVDHFVSWNEERSRAYDWSNYRFASGWLNSSKQGIRSAEMIDPFTVEDGWFEISLPSLQLVATPLVPEDMRARVQFVLERLHLRDDERVVRQRRAWYRLFQANRIALEGLDVVAPLLAAAIRKEQGIS